MTNVAPEPAPVALPELAPYKTRNGDMIHAGNYGVSHGSGLTGELIRHATSSWAGHAFVYVGNGLIIEGIPPVACVSSADVHPDAVYNAREPVSPAQRLVIVERAHALVGMHYDWPAYVGFALEILRLGSSKELDSVFKMDNWRVCSALVADCYALAGISIDAGGKAANLVSPADLYDRIAQQK